MYTGSRLLRFTVKISDNECYIIKNVIKCKGCLYTTSVSCTCKGYCSKELVKILLKPSPKQCVVCCSNDIWAEDLGTWKCIRDLGYFGLL